MPQREPAPDLAATLGPIELPRAGGGTSRLADLWADAPAVLVHLRHFG